MDLKGIDIRELEAELARRNSIKVTAPMPVANPDWLRLHQVITWGIESIATRGYIDGSFERHVYVTALEATYGKYIWDWIKSVAQPTNGG